MRVKGRDFLAKLNTTSLPPKEERSSTWVMKRVTVRNDMAVVVANVRVCTSEVISLAVVVSVAGRSVPSLLHHDLRPEGLCPYAGHLAHAVVGVQEWLPARARISNYMPAGSCFIQGPDPFVVLL